MFAAAYGLLWGTLLLQGILWRTPRRWLHHLATGLAAVAWGLWTAGLASRALAAGHWPMSTRYEFGLGFVWALLGLHILATKNTSPSPPTPLPLPLGEGEGSRQRRRGEGAVSEDTSPSPPTPLPIGESEVPEDTLNLLHPRSGIGGLGVTLALATWVLTRPAGEQVIAPLLPALRSPWFPLHTFAAALAYGACGAAAGLGLTALLEREEGRGLLLRRMDRLLRWSFLWLTLSMLLGGIWAREAWGRWWGWDPKETWSLVVWLAYLLPLHLGPLPSWRGRRYILLALLSFAGILFLFLGVPWAVRWARLETLHGF